MNIAVKKIRADEADGQPLVSSLRKMLGEEFDGNTWHVMGGVPGNSASYMTVNWGIHRASFSNAEARRWTRWKAYGKALVESIYDSPDRRIRGATSLVALARDVRSFCEHFCVEEGMFSVRQIATQDVEQYIDYVSKLNVSVSRADVKLSMLSYAWDHKEELGDGPAVCPFGHRERAAIARRIGVRNGHTPTIPPQEFFWIINEAIRLVKGATTLVADLDRYLALNGRQLKVGRAYRKASGRSSLGLFQEVRATYGGALIVLLAFTAVRKHESAAITHEDALRTIAEHVDLVGREYKGSGTAGGRKTERPVIPIVVEAMEVISKLTQQTRKNSRIRALLLRLPIQHSCSGNKSPQLTLDTRGFYNLLDTFSKYANIGRMLRPHMFRRAFALLWAWRFEVGDLYFLSRVLLHNSPEFTRAYAEDEDAWSFMPEVMREMTTEILEDSLLGINPLSGGIASALRRYARVLQASVSVADAGSIDALVSRLVSEQGIRIVPNADGYCFMSRGRAKYAKCSLDGVMPNYANRTPGMCAGCPNFGVDSTREDIWQNRLEKHELVVSTTQYPLLKDASIEGARICKKMLKLIAKERASGQEC